MRYTSMCLRSQIRAVFPGLIQRRIPGDDRKLYQRGLGGTRCDMATFIKEEYVGLTVIDEPYLILKWWRLLFQEVFSGRAS